MRKRIVLLVLAALLCCPGVLAAEPAEEGYILCLNDEAAAGELADYDLRPLLEEEGIYYTEDLSQVRELEDLGVLEAWEEDATVCLFDYAGDVDALKNEPWHRAMLGADYAAAHGVTGQDSQGMPVRVGIVDSGISADFSEHTTAAIVTGTNYCVEESDPLRSDTTDTIGHGTIVARVLASTDVGLVSGIELVPLKCFKGKDDGSISNIIEAIRDAVNVYHCDVINMSFGLREDDELLHRAVAYAYQNGCILVGACGNKDFSNDTRLCYPGAYDEVIAVGSVNSDKNVSSFSVQNGSVWITAPGGTLKMPNYYSTSESDKYEYHSGTSFAAPMVSAAAALALSVDPTLTQGGFKALLADTAEDRGETGRDNAYGCGLMNLGLLLATVTGDSESVIPSYYNKTLCLSAYRPAAEGAVTWLARYRENGQFFSAEGRSGSVNNARMSADAPLAKLMTVDADTFAPLRPAALYGFDAPGE